MRQKIDKRREKIHRARSLFDFNFTGITACGKSNVWHRMQGPITCKRCIQLERKCTSQPAQ
jgi:hypothetical protein